MEAIKNIFGILYWVGIIVLFIRGKVKLATFLSILTISTYPLIIGLITTYALPNNIIKGNFGKELAIILSLILIILSILSLFSPKQAPTNPQYEQSKISWLYFFSGLIVFSIGSMATLVFFYAPDVFGHSSTMPTYGIIANIASSTVSAFLFYMASKYGSVKKPNLLRTISSLVIFLFMGQSTLIISLILLYSMPVVPATSFPFLAALNMVCYIPVATVLILMRREHVVINFAA